MTIFSLQHLLVSIYGPSAEIAYTPGERWGGMPVQDGFVLFLSLWLDVFMVGFTCDLLWIAVCLHSLVA